MKVLELFAGIGACSKALKNLGIKVDYADVVEIDKYAIKSFNAVHGTDFEPQDITQWNKKIDNVDLIMHGSPCQDFSIAGKQAGGDEGSQTRSSLMYETIRIVESLKPKYVVWENVKNVLSKKHIHNFNNYINTMCDFGYNNYYQVLNAKDYGIPQNRERVFTVSIRADIDKGNFEFPEKEELKLKLKDLLETDVDEKFYLKDELTNHILSQLEKKDTLLVDLCQTRREGKPREYKDVSPCLSSRDYKEPRCIVVGNLDIKGQDIIKRVYSPDGISPTLTDMQGGNRQPKVCVGDSILLSYPSTPKNRVKKDMVRCITTKGYLQGVFTE